MEGYTYSIEIKATAKADDLDAADDVAEKIRDWAWRLTVFSPIDGVELEDPEVDVTDGPGVEERNAEFRARLERIMGKSIEEAEAELEAD